VSYHQIDDFAVYRDAGLGKVHKKDGGASQQYQNKAESEGDAEGMANAHVEGDGMSLPFSE
jgi:hypothetical protein